MTDNLPDMVGGDGLGEARTCGRDEMHIDAIKWWSSCTQDNVSLFLFILPPFLAITPSKANVSRHGDDESHIT